MTHRIDSGWFYRNEPLLFEADDYITHQAFRAAVDAYDRGETKIPAMDRNAHAPAQSYLDFMINGNITRTRMPQ